MIAILKLLILVPFLVFLSVAIAGKGWPVVVVLALIAGGFYFRAEQRQKERRAQLQQQVEITRQNMVAAQAEALRAQIKAEIEEKKDLPEGLKGQWN